MDTNAILTTKQDLTNRPCYRRFVDTFNQKCFNINQHTYAFNKLNTFVNICQQLTDSNDVTIAVEHLEMSCAKLGTKQAHFEAIL
ncbi:unnamed protein product [Oppiella nova]|uniref:Legumain prodomain domain-containing protein n=1 Tax=Oppiella nova TaxID=334625 RepID=A0A7R9MLP9_9ACAR|nr:unnamed protein product [Oppiella nova]CAG2179532.1 unnamed protein product [Oppiella nova]